MESSSPSWLHDLQEMEDDYNNFFPKEYSMNNSIDDYDEDLFFAHDIGNSIMFESPSNNNNYSSVDETSFDDERPSKFLKTSTNSDNNSYYSSLSPNFSSLSSSSSSSSSITSFQPQILCFDNSNSSLNNNDNTTQLYDLDYTTLNTKTKLKEVVNGSSKNQNLVTKSSSNGSKRSPSNAQDHIIAERKRREKISQSFIALAALVPGLKKIDKVTVLENAIKYVKDLKTRLTTLEQENNEKIKEIAEEPSVIVLNKRSPHDNESDDESVIVDDASNHDSSSLLHQVEARVSGQQVLIRIHCQKHKGILVKLLSEIQGHNLLVLNSSALPFGDSILDITVITRMGEGYNLTVKELVKSIRVETLKFILS
ncbi:transcription factor bHLH18-like isoform X3 [Arachis ipaensis]|uniref:transcription factor bHLH18-like isoform X3 n=1 Tax=Arachis ipaensis TaxID=130454 RepID=UPI0007AF21DB|nr:transcription factor bHLH18-like isoform X3 [Arachis ipaensis]XP_025627336.1 transcription factor bHLH18 isoform X3 [Arachis hypogaea]